MFFYPEKMLDVTDLSNTYGDVIGCNTMYWNNKSKWIIVNHSSDMFGYFGKATLHSPSFQ
jgi:hypothetical protein